MKLTILTLPLTLTLGLPADAFAADQVGTQSSAPIQPAQTQAAPSQTAPVAAKDKTVKKMGKHLAHTRAKGQTAANASLQPAKK